jgi:pimeloyl-ACP methyl ester carboxylesterase
MLTSILNYSLYYQITGNSLSPQTLLFVHGNSSSSKVWTPLIESSLLSAYKIVCLDLLGHGKSEWSKHPNTAYTFPFLLQIIQELVVALELTNITYIGHSLGAHVLMQGASLLPNLAGLVIIGAVPIQSPAQATEAYILDDLVSKIYQESLNESEIYELAERFLGNQRYLEQVALDFKNSDPQFRPSILENIPFCRNEWEQLAKLHFPPALLLGEMDMINTNFVTNTLPKTLLWQNLPIYVANAKHYCMLDQTQIVAQHIKSYQNYIHTKLNQHEKRNHLL